MAKFDETSGKPHKGIYCAYVRVSTEDQDVARQKMEILKYLNGGEHKIYWFEEEGVSGKIAPEKRPQLSACIEMARLHKGSIIVADLDRFSRSMVHTLSFFENILNKGKLNLIVCNDPSISNNYTNFAMKTMFAEFERNKISERTKSGLEKIKAELRANGSYKTKEGKKITKLGMHDYLDKARAKAGEVVTAEADGFASIHGPTIWKLLKAGDSYRSIAKSFNEMGVPSARAKPGKKNNWYASTIKNIANRYSVMGDKDDR
tara:strand:+ start:1621 stop:2403 length:783 start_codon:yes stop_codon:yes gene_type:complete